MDRNRGQTPAPGDKGPRTALHAGAARGPLRVVCDLPDHLAVTDAERRLVATAFADLIREILTEPE